MIADIGKYNTKHHEPFNGGTTIMVVIRINRSIIKPLGELLLSAIENADDLETAEVLSSAYLFTRALLHRFFPEI
ncbi:MAG: hypothetical protein ACPL1K_03695, partial [Candidatus Kryptoniota bacterium]